MSPKASVHNVEFYKESVEYFKGFSALAKKEIYSSGG